MQESEIKKWMDRTVLCWLATASTDARPNVSPKEIFTLHNGHIFVANIASPGTKKNLLENKQACIVFLDIFTQKGIQIKGEGTIIFEQDENWKEVSEKFNVLTKGAFPFRSIFQITPKVSKPILAPSYIMHPTTKEEDQIEAAKLAYGLSLERED